MNGDTPPTERVQLIPAGVIDVDGPREGWHIFRA